MSVNSKMTAIADPIRTLMGTTDKMGLDDMANDLETAVAEVDTQATLIQRIKTALEDKNGNAGTGVPVAKIGEKEYFTVERALASAVAGDTVTMIANSTENVNLIIPGGVTLDIQAQTLTVNGLIGLNGSMLNATTIKSSNIDGRLVVDKNNFVLPEKCAVQYDSTGNALSVIPIYDTALNCFRFARFSVLTDTANRKLTIDDETIRFQFKSNSTTKVLTEYLNNGATDNELRVMCHVEWTTTIGTSSYDIGFSDAQVGQVSTQAYDYTVTLTGYSVLGINPDTVRVKGMVVSNSGVACIGQTWGVNGVVE